METIIKPVIDELTSDEVKVAAPKIMEYLKEGSKSEKPELVIIMGPVAGGKSSHIRDNYVSAGYVWIDMARIFFDLQSQTGIKLNRRTQLINFIGVVTLDLALLEKRNIVIELVGDELERIDTLIDAMKAHGYKTKITMVNSANDGCFINEKTKKAEYMSSFYTEPFHLDWFERAAM